MGDEVQGVCVTDVSAVVICTWNDDLTCRSLCAAVNSHPPSNSGNVGVRSISDCGLLRYRAAELPEYRDTMLPSYGIYSAVLVLE